MGKHTARGRCQWDGCTETFFVTDLTSSERVEIESRPWYCVRHTNADEVLSPKSTERRFMAVATPSEIADGLFWGGRSGFIYGPGFKAYAKDFPAGTIIEVTAKIILPHKPEGQS